MNKIPTLTYTPQEITCQVRDGEQRVPAHVASNGLAYHRTPVSNGQLGSTLSVTHVKSGYAFPDGLTCFATRKQCQRLIALVDPLADWHQDAAELLQHPELLALVKQAAIQVRQES